MEDDKDYRFSDSKFIQSLDTTLDKLTKLKQLIFGFDSHQPLDTNYDRELKNISSKCKIIKLYSL